MTKHITDTTKAEALLANRAARSQAPRPVLAVYHTEVVVSSAANRGLPVAIEVVHKDGKWAVSASIGGCTAASTSLSSAVRAAAIRYNESLPKQRKPRRPAVRKAKYA